MFILDLLYFFFHYYYLCIYEHVNYLAVLRFYRFQTFFFFLNRLIWIWGWSERALGCVYNKISL